MEVVKPFEERNPHIVAQMKKLNITTEGELRAAQEAWEQKGLNILSYFKEHPSVNRFYFTSDGMAFTDVNHALAHTANLTDKNVDDVLRDDLKGGAEFAKSEVKSKGDKKETIIDPPPPADPVVVDPPPPADQVVTDPPLAVDPIKQNKGKKEETKAKK